MVGMVVDAFCLLASITLGLVGKESNDAEPKRLRGRVVSLASLPLVGGQVGGEVPRCELLGPRRWGLAGAGEYDLEVGPGVDAGGLGALDEGVQDRHRLGTEPRSDLQCCCDRSAPLSGAGGRSAADRWAAWQHGRHPAPACASTHTARRPNSPSAERPHRWTRRLRRPARGPIDTRQPARNAGPASVECATCDPWPQDGPATHTSEGVTSDANRVLGLARGSEALHQPGGCAAKTRQA